MASLPRRSKVFLAFIGLAFSFLLLFGAVSFTENERDWKSRKYDGLSTMISDITSLNQAQQYFGDIRVIEPNGVISMNE